MRTETNERRSRPARRCASEWIPGDVHARRQSNQPRRPSAMKKAYGSACELVIFIGRRL